MRALEEFSCLTGARLLAVDLQGEEPLPDSDALARACDRLRLIACPSVALATGPPQPALRSFLERFDVVVTGEAELDAVWLGVERNPLAATALVQLLRHSESRDTDQALTAESLAYSMLQGGPEFASWLQARAAKSGGRLLRGPPLVVERDGDRLLLTLNRPARHNAYSLEMRDGLVEALELAVADRSIREVVLRANGPSFCSGGDLDEFGTLPDPATAHVIRSTRNAARLLAACAPRVCAQLHGACVGAGIELAAFAASVVSRADAFFQLPELSMGLVPGAGGSVSLPRRIGRQRTSYMALTGARIDAETALGWGLIDEIS